MATAATLALVGTGTFTSQAAEPRLACGSVVKQSAVLTRDLRCSGDGLVIGADNVTLDLAGHHIQAGAEGRDAPGVVIAGARNVTVRNGSIASSGSGAGTAVVIAAGSHGASIRRIDTRGSWVGLRLERANRVTIRHSVIQGGSGTFVLSPTRRSVLSDNVIGGGDGNATLNGRHNTVTGNRFTGVEGDLLRVTGPRNRITGNTFQPVMGGVSVRGHHNVVRRNKSAGPWGIFVTGNANTVGGNSVRDAVTIGIFVTGHRNRILGNDVTRSGAEAFPAEADLAGIYVDDPEATVAHNRAYENPFLGILSVSAVRGAGNRAWANGDPRQCVGVACS